MYTEADFVPVSGLQHMVFCDRQAALIHVDGAWADNALTVEGTHLHRVVDEGRPTLREGIRTVRGISLRSARLGLVGKADAVELHPAGDDQPGVSLPLPYGGRWTIVPVEYKRGRPKAHRADEVQLCAQAMCLEEAYKVTISFGYLYYGKERRRTKITFDEPLRRITEDVASAFHDLVSSRTVPVRRREKKCERCSLLSVCMPPRRGAPASARQFLNDWLKVDLSGGSAP